MKRFDIAVIPGDGIGREVVPAGCTILDTVAQAHGGFRLRYKSYPWSCAWYLKHGKMMPDDGLKRIGDADAIYLGAVGFPGVADHISLWGLLIPIRRGFQQYACVRPVKLLPGVRSPLAGRGPQDIDFIVVRENNEGEYSSMGGRIYSDSPHEVVTQLNLFTRRGTERIIRYAFDLARRKKKKKVTSATKSNGIIFSMPFWDEVFWQVAREYPGIAAEQMHIDALSARFVTHPQNFGVVVGSNLFGDILTDLGAAIAGSIGIGASANLNPEKKFPSMFEPVHGSAPDIVGKGIANPLGQIWSGAMMLEHLGIAAAANLVVKAMSSVLASGVKTADLGGRASTRQVTAAVAKEIRRLAL
ncbi:MAG TPA: tartrate dehydrogenase [Burkholderiales bacterium]|jgi:tartrate dehydrogenase/decarboxylase/D-malate dehydrogenase